MTIETYEDRQSFKKEANSIYDKLKRQEKYGGQFPDYFTFVDYSGTYNKVVKIENGFIIQLECEGNPIKVTDTTIDILLPGIDNEYELFYDDSLFNTRIGEVIR